MAKQKRNHNELLGPDGRPIDRARYARRPDPVPQVPPRSAASGTLSASDLQMAALRVLWGQHDRIIVGSFVDGTGELLPAKPRQKPLDVAVAEQLGELTDDLPFKGHPELPKPEPDLTAYNDAFESARKACPHANLVEHLYGREWFCEDCRKILDRDAIRRARGGGLGYYFGG